MTDTRRDESPTPSAASLVEAKPSHLTWPADQFYWAFVETPALSGDTRGGLHRQRTPDRASPIAPAFLPDLADQVPEPIEALHAVMLPAADGRVVICAARIEDLLSLPPHITRLTPASLPPGAAAPEDSLADRLDLLVGAFEPPTARRARHRRRAASLGFVVALAALVAIGLWRRAEHAGALAAAARQAAGRLLSEVSPPAISAEDLAVRLARERAVAGIDLASHRAPDAAGALATLLEAWPRSSASATDSPQTHSIAVGPDAITLAIVVPGDAAAFLAAFKPPSGWRLEEPRLLAVDSKTRLTLRLVRPRAAAEGGSP